MTKVDAVYQTIDGRILFFVNEAVYSFERNKRMKVYKLSDLGIDSNVQKIDKIFRKPNSHQTFIFIGENYFKFDEHKLLVTGSGTPIEKAFKDVYGMDTAFTYTNNNIYFFKGEFYYEFIKKTCTLEKMRPMLSANFFMDCNVEYPVNYVTDFSFEANSKRDFIDLGPNFGNPDLYCDNVELESKEPSAASYKSFNITFIMLSLTNMLA
jgi:hypothetical protein